MKTLTTLHFDTSFHFTVQFLLRNRPSLLHDVKIHYLNIYVLNANVTVSACATLLNSSYANARTSVGAYHIVWGLVLNATSRRSLKPMTFTHDKCIAPSVWKDLKELKEKVVISKWGTMRTPSGQIWNWKFYEGLEWSGYPQKGGLGGYPPGGGGRSKA